MADPFRLVRLATFNIRHAARPSGKVDVVALRQACADLQADVLALQEVDVATERVAGADLAAEAAEACAAVHAFGATIQRHPGEYGNAVLVRGGLEDVEVLVLPRWQHAEPRGAVLATAVLADMGRLSVAACHLGLHGRPMGSEARGQLVDVLAHLRQRPPPRVVLGDFNLSARRARPLLEATGMALAGGPATFPARLPVRRIDHVGLAELTPRRVVVPRAPVSDHRPLVVEAVTSRR